MNQQNDSNNIDPEVAQRYAATRGEKVPGKLDDAVLHEARRAVRADAHRGWFGTWFRPLAFALSVGLSLAIVLELSDSGLLGRQPEALSDAASGLPGAAQPTEFERAQLNDLRRREKPGISGNETPEKMSADDAALPRSELRTQAPDTGLKVEQRTTESNMAQPGTASNDVSAVAETDRDRAPVSQGDAGSQPSHCDDEARAVPETWWDCIESLRNAGLAEQAQWEEEALQKRFPEFDMRQ
ncbi:MAG: hypothetical protein R3192_03200 [Woeseiaceae bacterium]|nr:hypothetical protein [Woeseiaceae bacterium]